MDLKTIFICLALISLTGLFLSLYLYKTNTYKYDGAFTWLLAVIFATLSPVTLALHGILPVLITINLSNSLIIFAPMLVGISLRRFYHLRISKAFLFIGIFFVILFNVMAPISPTKDRIIIISLAYTILWLEPAAILLQKIDQVKKADYPLGLAFLLISPFSLYRLIATWIEPNPENLLSGSISQKIYLSGLIVIWLVVIFGYMLIIYKHAFEKIILEEARYKVAIDQNPHSIIQTNLNGEIISTNQAFADTTGYPGDVLTGKNMRILKSGYHEKDFYKNIWDTLLAGQVWKGEIKNKKRDGSLFWEKAIITPVKDQDGKIISFFAIKEDITHQKRLEEFKNSIESLMKHDLKTPLNAIINFPIIMLEDQNLSEEQREFLGIIKSSGEQALEQIERSMDLYKLEAGTYVEKIEQVVIAEIINEIVVALQSLTMAHNIRIEILDKTDFAHKNISLTIHTDKILLYRILSNLIKNAIEASQYNSSVVITLLTTGSYLVIDIHNQGEIPRSVQKIFFSKFSTFGKTRGTGLGTYIARLLCEYLGFEISFTSDPEEGTHLVVQIPATLLK